MGGLIQTKGTKLLAAHFRLEFSTYIDFYRAPAHRAYFDTSAAGWNPAGTGGLLNATNSLYAPAPHSLRTDIVGPPAQGRCLLPYFPTGTRHGNLQNRWLWFLNTSPSHVALGSLTPANDIAIADAIHAALAGPPYSYDSITFDAVETILPQQVAATPAYDDGTLYMHISLLTQQPIPPAGDTGTGLPPLDA
jgi:hypothetical protein